MSRLDVEQYASGQARDILRIGTRNVVRNLRRSLVTGGMIALGVAAIVFFRGYIRGLADMMLDQVVENEVGALQVERQGYSTASDLAPLDLDLPQGPELEAALRSVPQIGALAPRLRFGAMLLHGEDFTLVGGVGVDPAAERVVCPKGAGSQYLAGTDDGRHYGVMGPGLSGVDAAEVVVGYDLALGLGLKPGDQVTLLAQTQRNSTDAVDATVAGVYRTGDSEINKRLVMIPLGLAQKLLHMPGRVTSYVMSAQRDAIDEAAAGLRAALSGSELAVEVRTWEELAPYYRDVARLQNDLMGIVTGLLFVLVLAGVVNTMTMAAFERQREVGTLMALGFRRRAILGLFLTEACTLGLVAGAVGAALGSAVVAVTGQTGLPMAIPAVGSITNHPQLDGLYTLLAPGAALLGAVLAGLYPAWHASRQQPVEALRAT